MVLIEIVLVVAILAAIIFGIMTAWISKQKRLGKNELEEAKQAVSGANSISRMLSELTQTKDQELCAVVNSSINSWNVNFSPKYGPPIPTINCANL